MQIATNEFQKELKEHGDYSFPLLVSKEKLSSYESGSFLWHWHPEIEITLVTKGEMIYQINNESYHLKAGQAIFGNSSTLHSGHMVNQLDCEYTAITFDAKLIYGYENSLIYHSYIRPILKNYALSSICFDLSKNWHFHMIDLLKQMIEIDQQKYLAYEFDLLSLLSQFWKELYQNNEIAIADTSYDKTSYDRIRKIVHYIEEHYASDLTLEMIADSIGVCRSECSRIFKKHMNISLFDFIAQYRIEKSVDYLTNTDLSIIEIAELVGFHDSNYYTKVFHKRKGCSPSRYRKSL